MENLYRQLLKTKEKCSDLKHAMLEVSSQLCGFVLAAFKDISGSLQTTLFTPYEHF